jgi:ATP synthase protein I
MNPDSRQTPGGMAKQIALASELPVILVAECVAGGFFGYLLDGWLHTKPWLMLALGAVGFAAGVWTILSRLKKDDERNASGR